MMADVTRITPHLSSLQAPTAIRDLPAWVIWRFEARADGGKPRKVPYYAAGAKRSGQQGGPEDVAQLVTFDAARTAAARRGFDGVGFCTLPQWHVVAVDVDDCVTAGRVHPDIEPLLCQTYAEFSPSGRGVRMFFRGDLGNGKALGEPYGLELFSTVGYVTFTGNLVPGCEVLGLEDTVAPVPEALRKLHQDRFGSTERPASTTPRGLTEDTIQQALQALPADLDYDTWVKVGMAVHAETAGKGFDLWEAWSARSPKHSSRGYDLERWKSFGKYTGPSVTGGFLVHLANQHGAGIHLGGPASALEFDALVAEGENAEALRFQFLPPHEFAGSAGGGWIVKGVLPAAGLAVIFGASGSGKSFFALDMAFAIARGEAWRGRRVVQGRVAYICAEGAEGFRKRLSAYAQHHRVDLSTVPMGILPTAPDFMAAQDAADVVAAIRASGGASVVIVDTFAQVTPGANENAGEDVGKALGHCRRIHEATGALVVLVHHAGKDTSKGARGWSGLRAACDAELEVVREEAGRWVRLTKSKDGEDGLQWGFGLEVVELGVDEDLDPITSCVVVESAVPVPAQAPPRLGALERVILDVAEGLAAMGQASVDRVISGAVERLPAVPGVRDRRRERVTRALQKLLEGAIFCKSDEFGMVEVVV
jgi:hypothetical protein